MEFPATSRPGWWAATASASTRSIWPQRGDGAGHHPEIILAGRRINDGMGPCSPSASPPRWAGRNPPRILVLGLTFKENVPDLRNTKVVDLMARLRELGHEVDVHDACADAAEARHEYGLEPAGALRWRAGYDCVVGAVPHRAYARLDAPRLAALVRPAGWSPISRACGAAFLLRRHSACGGRRKVRFTTKAPRHEGAMSKRVMPGLVPGIHAFFARPKKEDVDGRAKPGHDERRGGGEIVQASFFLPLTAASAGRRRGAGRGTGRSAAAATRKSRASSWQRRSGRRAARHDCPGPSSGCRMRRR